MGSYPEEGPKPVGNCLCNREFGKEVTLFYFKAWKSGRGRG